MPSSPRSPAVVPAPVSLTADDAAAPFALGPGIHVSGTTDAPAAFAALLTARTGLDATVGDDGAIAFRLESGGTAESYRITVDDASVTVAAPDAAGLFYGAQTLGQLVVAADGGWIVPAVEIVDAPRFGYRGLMLDVARHFFDVATVEAYVDRAASLKLNVLHLHLSDDQGWRLHLDSRPRLTERASATAVGGDAGGFYTKDDYARLVAYAASRHVVVVPELDMPGHTHAVGLAYPELAEPPVPPTDAVQDDREPRTGTPYTGIAVGFSSLRIDDERTYDFVADVFGELAAMTPGPYLHFGGDESLATSPEDFATFVTRTSAIIAHLGKTPVAWHEAGAAPGIADDTVGQYWGFTTPDGGADELARAFVANGSRIVLSPADAVYLDMKYDDATTLGLTWANGPTSVRRAYEWEPAAVVPGVGDGDILGVEAALWTETGLSRDDLDTLAFPRLAAAAEAAWSPATGTSGLRTWDSFRARVGALGPLWSSLGIHYFRSPEIAWEA